MAPIHSSADRNRFRRTVTAIAGMAAVAITGIGLVSPASAAVTIYQHSDYAGYWARWDANGPSNNNLWNVKTGEVPCTPDELCDSTLDFEDMISSLKNSGSVRICFYKGRGYSGSYVWAQPRTNYVRVSPGFNDTISSFKPC